MGYRGIGHGAYRQWGTGGMGHMGNRGTGGMGYGPHRQWVTWAMGVHGQWGYRGMGNGAHGQFAPKNVKKMSSCQKDVKLSKRCQMSKNQTPRLWRMFTKKLN